MRERRVGKRGKKADGQRVGNESEGKLARQRKCIPGSCQVFQDDVAGMSWLTMMVTTVLLITKVQNPKCQ